MQLTLTDTKTRFRCIWFIQKVYWMVYKNGGDGGGDGGDAPLLVWWVWCYLVYWFPDLNLVKNSVGTQNQSLCNSNQTISLDGAASWLCSLTKQSTSCCDWFTQHLAAWFKWLSHNIVGHILIMFSELHVDCSRAGWWVLQIWLNVCKETMFCLQQMLGSFQSVHYFDLVSTLCKSKN